MKNPWMVGAEERSSKFGSLETLLSDLPSSTIPTHQTQLIDRMTNFLGLSSKYFGALQDFEGAKMSQNYSDFLFTGCISQKAKVIRQINNFLELVKEQLDPEGEKKGFKGSGKGGGLYQVAKKENQSNFIRVDQKSSKAFLQILNFLCESNDKTDIFDLKQLKRLLSELKQEEELIEAQLAVEEKHAERSSQLTQILNSLTE